MSLGGHVGAAHVVGRNPLAGAGVELGQLGGAESRGIEAIAVVQRQERRQRAEERAAKAPVMIMLPTIGCIFPSLFIVILAPAALSALSSCGSF